MGSPKKVRGKTPKGLKPVKTLDETESTPEDEQEQESPPTPPQQQQQQGQEQQQQQRSTERDGDGPAVEDDSDMAITLAAYDSFAEQYHDMVHELPLEYHRTFTLLTDLEHQHQAALVRLCDAIKDLVRQHAKDKSRDKDKDKDRDPGKHGREMRRRDSRDDGDGVMSADWRAKLTKLATEGREALRCAEEKVGLAVALYETVDRQIQSLDASLLRTEDSMLIGLRPGTLPSHDAPAYAPKSPPGRTTGWGARMVEGDAETRVRGGRSRKKIEDELEDVDPNEPTYCFCERVSFGEMIGCENDDCAREWFHLGCVGLDAAPEGKWYCSECVAALNLDSPSGERVKVDNKGKRSRDSITSAAGGDRDRKRKKGGHRW